jgi:hypothetical protein
VWTEQTTGRQEKTMIDSTQSGPPNPEEDDDKQEPVLQRDTVEDLEPLEDESANLRAGKAGKATGGNGCGGFH